MAILAPAKCPKCGCPTLSMQVIAWAIFRDGKFETLEVGEEVEPIDDTIAVCGNEKCGHDWSTWEWIG